MTDLSRIRISDADRSEVIDILQRATVEGRLDLDELEDRVSSALAARTWSDVDPLIEDLPIVTEEPAEEPDDEPAEPSAAMHAWSLATLAGGAVAVAGSFVTPWGALLGIFSTVAGASLLLGIRELTRGDRAAVLTGMILGLLPSVFFLMLLLMLGI
ncbi:DUF1707 domain-containing protein [Actinoplanes sp. NPDC051343]|uniref:DUF1707 domain-containing protein n=1 Tax=Actinoplanes sp. NPDC051343 TaxID=3363906 RepID=UPI00379A73C3